VSYVSVLGILGFTVQLAALHDILFFCSIWFFMLYSAFALIY